MTTLIERLRIWASTGTKTKPADVKIDAGWVGGEQPPFEYENERMNTRDTQLVGCVDAVNDSTAGGRSLFKYRSISACIPESIGFPYSADNYFDSGDALINCACLYEYEGDKQLIFSHVPAAGTSYIKAYNINTKANTNHPFTGDLVLDVCSAGPYVYILYANLNGSDYDYFLAAVDGNDWTARPGWGVHPQLGSEPTATIDGRPFCAVALSGNIVCGGRWYGTAADKKLHVINSSTGAIMRSGDAGLAATEYPSGNCVVVNDALIYTGLDSASGDTLRCDAYEADLTLGGNQGGTPVVHSGELLSVLSLGDYVLTASKPATYAQTVAYTEALASHTFTTFATDAGTKIGPMVFDGVNVWILFKASISTDEAMVVRRFSPQSLGVAFLNLDFNFANNPDNNHLLRVSSDVSPYIGYMRPPMVFDGSGIWVSPYALTGTDFSGEWFRIPNVHNR